MAGDATGASSWSYPAGVDLSVAATSQFIAVQTQPSTTVSGNGQGNTVLVPFDGTGKPVVGILQSCPKKGEAGTVMLRGVSYCIAGGTWEGGDALTAAPGGHFTKAGSGDVIVGIADQSAVPGDTSTIILK